MGKYLFGSRWSHNVVGKSGKNFLRLPAVKIAENPSPLSSNNIVTSSSAKSQLRHMRIFSGHCNEDDIYSTERIQSVSRLNKQLNNPYLDNSCTSSTTTQKKRCEKV